MTKRLELQFETEEGKNRTIGVTNPQPELDPGVVQAAMDQIIEQDMFEIEGIKLFTKVRGARYVTRTVEDILETE